MERCKECIYYDHTDSYKGSGYCLVEHDYVKDDDKCDDYEGEE